MRGCSTSSPPWIICGWNIGYICARANQLPRAHTNVRQGVLVCCLGALQTYKRYHGNVPNISSIIYVCSCFFSKSPEDEDAQHQESRAILKKGLYNCFITKRLPSSSFKHWNIQFKKQWRYSALNHLKRSSDAYWSLMGIHCTSFVPVSTCTQGLDFYQPGTHAERQLR
jgi:hypothetical protein